MLNLKQDLVSDALWMRNLLAIGVCEQLLLNHVVLKVKIMPRHLASRYRDLIILL